MISACSAPSPPEAQRPSSRVVSSAMAAGIACVGSLVELPPCWMICQLLGFRAMGTRQHTIIVYNRALVKPEVPTRFLAVWKRAWKSDWYRKVEPSDLVEP